MKKTTSLMMVIGLLCGVLALLAVTSSHAEDTIKMKGKAPAQGEFVQIRKDRVWFEFNGEWATTLSLDSVESIEFNPPKKVEITHRGARVEGGMLLKSFSRDEKGKMESVLVKDGKEMKKTGSVMLKTVVDSAQRFSDLLPTPTDAQIKAAKPLPDPGRYSKPPANVGPLGVIAQRLPWYDARRGYLILRRPEEGSPADGRLLPGDRIIGLNGGLFTADKYVNKEVESFKKHREPNWEMGRGIHEVYSKGKGILTLTVHRGRRKGIVKLNIGNKKPLSRTYPWNCVRSQELCKEIAENYVTEVHGDPNLQTWMAAWNGLFLLNYDPTEYRSVIDDIAKRVLKRLDTYKLSDELRGEGYGWLNRNDVWKISFEAIFLAEYAMITNQSSDLRGPLNRYVELLFASRLAGNLWGHSNTFNYGFVSGGFIGASSQASLALQCLQKAGANVTRLDMQKVLDSLSASISRRDGRVTYYAGMSTHYGPGGAGGRAVAPFDWETIGANTSQVKRESTMRQGAVCLGMHFAGRMPEAEASYHFLRRQTAVFATHGMTQDPGVFEGVRALASCSPKDCRALLDSYLPRLYMTMRWDGGVRAISGARGGNGDYCYAPTERGLHRYIPAVMGLMLSMPAKRLYLFSKVMEPGNPPLAWGPRRPRKSMNECSIEHLTYADDSAYFASHDTATPSKWAIYRHRFSGTSSRGKKEAIISNLGAEPRKLRVWKDKLIVSTWGRGKNAPGAVMSWDMKRGGEPQVLNSYHQSRAHQFTEYGGSLYYIPPDRQLWRTRDGLSAERVEIIPDNQRLYGLLHGTGAWQSIAPNARSLQMVELGIGPRLFCKTQKTDGSTVWAKPLESGPTMWLTDGSPGKAQVFYREPERPKQWPPDEVRCPCCTLDDNSSRIGKVMAVDDNNSRIGSLIGFCYDKRLFFSKDGQLRVSTREGTKHELFKLGGKAFGAPNNFATFTHAGKPTLVFSFTDAPFDRQTPDMKRMLAITDGKKLIATLQGPEGGHFNDIRFLTSVGDSLYFVGITGKHGAELWHTDGTQAGTRLIRDFQPGPGSSLVDNLVGLNGKIYFTTWHEKYGSELWRHDPKTGQLMVADIVPGEEGSRPEQVRAYGQWLVFAMDATVGGGAVLRYAEGEPNKHVSFVPANNSTATTAPGGRF
jgi:ELWxxDGT repeat protein